MPIDFSLLGNPQNQPGKITPIMGAAPASNGGGIGDLFQGLATLKNSFNPPKTEYKAPTEGVGTPLAPTPSNPMGNNSLVQTASSMVGKNEYNEELKAYLQKANPGLDPAQTPWCAGYIGSVLNASGLKGTGSLAAKSYLKYGQESTNPTTGDIVVFNDLSGKNDPNRGHVGFVKSIDQKAGTVTVIGGNQDNQVSEKVYPISKVAGFRTPPTGQEVQAYAQQQGITDPNQLANLPKQINQQSYLPKDAHPELSATMSGIAHVETSSEKDPYQAVGVNTKIGKAMGKYQIMSSNVPAWSQEALGYPLTPGQFLANPELQERIAGFQMNKLLKEGKTPQDVQSIWFTGRTRDKAGNAKDALGTTNDQYNKKFNQGYLRARNT